MISQQRLSPIRKRQRRSNLESIARDICRFGTRKLTASWGEDDHNYKAGATSNEWSTHVTSEQLQRSSIDGLLDLVMVALPFVLPQVGVPAVLLLRVLRSNLSTGAMGAMGAAAAAGHPLTFRLDQVKPPPTSPPAPGVPVCTICQRCEATVVNLPCTHRLWCGNCASRFVAPLAQHKPIIVTCLACMVRVEKMLLQASVGENKRSTASSTSANTASLG